MVPSTRKPPERRAPVRQGSGRQALQGFRGGGRARWRVLVLLFLLSVLTYLDRVCISTTAPAMMQELGITPLEMGMVFSVFVLGYALFEIPGGWTADRFGARAARVCPERSRRVSKRDLASEPRPQGSRSRL